MGIVHAMQTGQLPKKGKAGQIAKKMKKKDAEDFASTKHKGLPKKVKKENKMISLKDLMRENFEDGSFQKLSPQQRREVIEAVSRFNEFGKTIYRNNEIKEMVESIKSLTEMAGNLAIQESGDWFDAVTVKKDVKEIKGSSKVFEKTANEIASLQQRLESIYEDMGHKLGRYYKINEALDAVGKEDDDVDNDGDSDEADEYLKKKRAAVTKAVKNETKLTSIVKEAPKMKSSPFVEKVKTIDKILSGINNTMKFKDKNGWDRCKNDFKKAEKALANLSDAIRLHGSNLVK